MAKEATESMVGPLGKNKDLHIHCKNKCLWKALKFKTGQAPLSPHFSAAYASYLFITVD